MRLQLTLAALMLVGCGASQPTLTSRAQATCAPSMCPFVGVWESSPHAHLSIDGESLFAHTGWTPLIDPDVCSLTQQRGLYRHRLVLHEAELHASICWVERRFHIEGGQLIEADGTVYARVDESRSAWLMQAVARGDFGEDLGTLSADR